MQRPELNSPFLLSYFRSSDRALKRMIGALTETPLRTRGKEGWNQGIDEWLDFSERVALLGLSRKERELSIDKVQRKVAQYGARAVIEGYAGRMQHKLANPARLAEPRHQRLLQRLNPYQGKDLTARVQAMPEEEVEKFGSALEKETGIVLFNWERKKRFTQGEDDNYIVVADAPGPRRGQYVGGPAAFKAFMEPRNTRQLADAVRDKLNMYSGEIQELPLQDNLFEK